MLENLTNVLKDAKEKHYAVGLFNTINLEMARGVLAAAEELRSPVIIGTAEVLQKYTPLEYIADMLAPMARRASVPVVLHLDHGLTEENIMRAVALGFSSVMYDCSSAPYEENVSRVAALTEYVHRAGCTIEAELGHVGSSKDGDSASDFYTQPEQALDYVTRTGVDALAVAIGTAHGVYKSTPKLDIGRLSEISAAVKTPLVLHGGSGLSDKDFRNCIQNGISKVNIFTDINLATLQAAGEAYVPGKGMSVAIPDIVSAIKEAACKKMLVFGSQNRS
ncbi:MAG: ketose-bisphosphate aldolase [Oscillospiraceae bacterium]